MKTKEPSPYRLGSVRQIIDVNADVKWLYTYGPFGKKLESDDDGSPVENPFQFVGQYFDAEIAQLHLRARQYDPHLSRFTAIDPVYGNFNEPLTLHPYLYCLNDPLNRYDLTGEFSLVDTTYSMGRYASMTMKAYDIGDRALSLAKMVAQGASVQNIMTTIAIEMVTDKVGGKFFDRWAGGLTRRFNKRMGKLLPGRYTNMGVTSSKKGHHLIPEWLGGDATQLTSRLNRKQHDLLEAKIRKRMKKYSFSIGGRGNLAGDTFDEIVRNGDLGNVMDDLLDIYKDFDRTHGTSLKEGFMINMLGGAGEQILDAIR